MLPKTRYAKSGSVHIAYQTFGNGDVDLVFVPGFVSNVEIYWEEPHFARWLRRLGSFARVSAALACRTGSRSFLQWMNAWMTCVR